MVPWWDWPLIGNRTNHPLLSGPSDLIGLFAVDFN